MEEAVLLVQNMTDAALDGADRVSQKTDNDSDNAMLSRHLTIRGGREDQPSALCRHVAVLISSSDLHIERRVAGEKVASGLWQRSLRTQNRHRSQLDNTTRSE